MRDVVGVLLQATLDTLGMQGGMDAVRGSSYQALAILEMVTWIPEPRYCARFFQLCGEGKGSLFLLLGHGDDNSRDGTSGVLPFRDGLLSPPTTVLRCARPMLNIRPRPTRALLPRSSIDIPRTPHHFVAVRF